LTIAAGIEDHRAHQAVSANVDTMIAIVESRPFLRECIRRSMQSALSSTVVTCLTLSELGDPPHHRSVDLVVLSLIEAGAEACANALKALSGFASGRPVIVLGSTNDADLARAALRCGAKGFIPVTMGFEIAIEAMRFVLAGGTYVPPDSLLAPEPINLIPPPTLPRLNILTGRELSVVRAIQQGKSNKVIAYELNMCESTVKVHVRNIMRKLNAKNRTDVAMQAQSIRSAESSTVSAEAALQAA
jgi:DNA-binding NarL/FixJ family response regulator